MCHKAWGLRLLDHFRSQWPGPSIKWATWWVYHSCCQYGNCLVKWCKFMPPEWSCHADCGWHSLTLGMGHVHGFGTLKVHCQIMGHVCEPALTHLHSNHDSFSSLQQRCFGHSLPCVEGVPLVPRIVTPTLLASSPPWVGSPPRGATPISSEGLRAFRTVAKTQVALQIKVLSCLRSKHTKHS